MSVDLELLQSIALAVGQARDTEVVLQSIVAGLADEAAFALARIWLLEPAGIPKDGATTPSLRLAASAGRSAVDGSLWNGVSGEFARIPVGHRKIGHIAQRRESLRLDERQVADSRWTVHPDWVARERIKGFAGHPLLFRDEVLGVIAVFSREPVAPREFQWLRLFADQAAVSIANARAFEEIESLRRRLELENEYLRGEVRENFSGWIGRSPALQKTLQQIEFVAPTDSTVLISGESGTGKELVARAVHERSKRAGRALVKVNCASIPHELFESEFFGHVKGAFTGALRDRAGRFELAHQGTLFLDEAGEIPLSMQGKLLRVLQEGEYERVGDERTRRVDARIIAATNRNLAAEVAAGRFRQDLYFRLSVIPLEIPPLRDRLDDIPALAAHFLREAALRSNVREPKLTEAHARELMEYPWPGNIRELRNVMERAVILSQGGPMRFQLASAGTKAARGPSPPLTRTQWLESQKPAMEAALRESGGKIYGPGGAAERLGLRPTTLASRIAALGIAR